MKRREHLGVLATMLPGALPVLGALPALGALAGGTAAWAAPAAPGQRVRWPEVPLLDGGHFGAAQAADRAVVVVFWSTTCPFCRNHNKHVQKLHRAAQGRALAVLGVARESDAAVVRAYARVQGYEFPITLHTRPMAEALSTRNVIPLTAVVDRQGRLKQVLPGEMFEEDVMELLALAG